MNFMNKLKQKLLNKSGSYNYYVNESKKLTNDNEGLKNEISALKDELNKSSSLEEEISNLKNDLTKHDNLIKFLMDDEKYPYESLNFCPLCGNVGNFNSFGNPERNHVMCPTCHSLERDRLAYLELTSEFSHLFNKQLKLLHFAPEEALYPFFSSNGFDYYPVDFQPEIYESRGLTIIKQVNMEEVPYDDGAFDVIYASHVLEHVPDDIKGMTELYRVLKDDGICFVAIPLYDIPETIEKEEYNTPELRLKYYGQDDHLRKYGHDFKGRLESVGFNVEVITISDIIKEDSIKKVYSITDNDKLFICTK